MPTVTYICLMIYTHIHHRKTSLLPSFIPTPPHPNTACTAFDDKIPCPTKTLPGHRYDYGPWNYGNMTRHKKQGIVISISNRKQYVWKGENDSVSPGITIKSWQTSGDTATPSHFYLNLIATGPVSDRKIKERRKGNNDIKLNLSFVII